MRLAKLLDGYLNKEELAAELGYSSVTLKRWLTIGYGPTPTYVGRAVLFSREGVTKWLREQEGKKLRGRQPRGAVAQTEAGLKGNGEPRVRSSP
jgi:hypothetical protein